MKKVKLKKGCVVVPDKCVVMYDSRTENSNYAAIIAEKHQTIQRYLVFSEYPLDYSTEIEEDLIFFAWGKYYPQLRSVWLSEVNAIFDEDGRLLNAKEWDDSPRLGLFPVKEVTDENNLICGTGIIR